MLSYYKNKSFKIVLNSTIVYLIFLKIEIIFLYFLKMFVSFFNYGYFLVIGKQKKKHTWIVKGSRKLNFFWLNNFIINNFSFSCFYLNETFYLLDADEYNYSILGFKNEIAYLKKKNTYRKNILFEYNSYRHNFFHTMEDLLENSNSMVDQHTINTNNYWASIESDDSDTDVEDTDMLSEKSIEGHRKFKMLINENRNMFRELYKIKSPRQYMFNKKFMYFFKREALIFIKTLEFNIVNLTLRTSLVFNKNFFLFIMDNHGIYLNGRCITTTNIILKATDRVEFHLLKINFILYKKSIEKVFILDKKAQDKVWKINRYIFNIFKQEPKNISGWVVDLINIDFDVPKFLEIDYSRFLYIFVYEPYLPSDFSWYNLRFVNFFLLRAYNWKYII